MNEDKIKTALKEAANKEWSTHKKPILLSNLPKILREEFKIDYKLILGSQSIKQFIKNNSQNSGFRLIQHPSQKAKIAILPTNAEYSFPNETQYLYEVNEITKNDLNGFLNVLNSLSNEDLARLKIPADIAIHIFRKSQGN